MKQIKKRWNSIKLISIFALLSATCYFAVYASPRDDCVAGCKATLDAQLAGCEKVLNAMIDACKKSYPPPNDPKFCLTWAASTYHSCTRDAGEAYQACISRCPEE